MIISSGGGAERRVRRRSAVFGRSVRSGVMERGPVLTVDVDRLTVAGRRIWLTGHRCSRVDRRVRDMRRRRSRGLGHGPRLLLDGGSDLAPDRIGCLARDIGCRSAVAGPQLLRAETGEGERGELQGQTAEFHATPCRERYAVAIPGRIGAKPHSRRTYTAPSRVACGAERVSNGDRMSARG